MVSALCLFVAAGSGERNDKSVLARRSASLPT
jgi:hypothetical protein